ncbi:MAG TPA: hypothetical protein VK655_10800 [Solirubrobacteraceae bacterium]|nr:hypothetical protein [Solirubrobacteraceae bacterium]
MSPENDESTQTTPKGAVIPVPTREQVLKGLKKIAKPIAKPSDDGSPQK